VRLRHVWREVSASIDTPTNGRPRQRQQGVEHDKKISCSVTAQGNRIQSTRTDFALRIEAGCNGIEAVIILAAAMLAFPAVLLQRLAGLLIGTATIVLLNIVRIMSLFYLA
jgi:exosortase/archaeosortase